MTATHFFISPEQEAVAGGEVLLEAEDSRHALRSLRLRPGETVTVADGSGLWATGVVAGERDGRALVEVHDVRREERPKPALIVAIAPPKGDRLSWAVQKLGELGADALSLIETERTIRFPPDDDHRRRLSERLRSIAREAAMQSRRPFIMETGEFQGFREALLDVRGLTVVLHEEGSLALSEVPSDIAQVTLFVGPEGGFADREIEDARLAGASLASLGRGILRTETAALVGATLVLARFGRLG